MPKHIMATLLLLAACDEKPDGTAVGNTTIERGAAHDRSVGWRSNNEHLRNLSEQQDDQRRR